jgi:hypothetical protein
MKRALYFRPTWVIRHPRLFWWALMNWLRGLAYSPVGRCRECDHTTPYHYPICSANEQQARGG